MIQRFKVLGHKSYIVSIDSLGERQLVYKKEQPFIGAISLIENTENTNNNVISETTTHVCITQTKGFSIKDKIVDGTDAYLITFAIEQGRFTRLFLMREVDTLAD